MTTTLLLLVALYLVWRVATLAGRRRQRAQQVAFGRRGWTWGAVGEAAACARCGRALQSGETAWEGRLGSRRPVCAGGCQVAADGENLG